MSYVQCAMTNKVSRGVGQVLYQVDHTTACCTRGSPTPVTRFFTCDARYLFDLVRTFPRDRLGAVRARPDRHTPCTVASVPISVASHSSQPFKRKGTHKSCRSTASGNDFPDADLASLSLLVRGQQVRARIRTKHTILAVPIHADPLGPSDRHPDCRMRTLLARATNLVCTRGSNAFSRNRYRSAEVPGARRKRLAQNPHR